VGCGTEAPAGADESAGTGEHEQGEDERGEEQPPAKRPHAGTGVPSAGAGVYTAP
jgi:hypothetical protein